jgi:hypothetical protein
MDNFKAIYKILKRLEEQMDDDLANLEGVKHTDLQITENRWTNLLRMLANEGYIEGINVVPKLEGRAEIVYSKPGIKLDGLQFLKENSMMKKAENLVKGIATLKP